MNKTRASKSAAPPSLFAKAVLPFALPILLTLAILLLVGNHWPRDIAPGSGLKLAGLCSTAITALVVWHHTTAHMAERKVRQFAAVLCAVTGLMGWPVWSVGVLPSVNGAVLSNQTTVRMTLERTEVTHASKSRELYHWAWLKAESGNSLIGSGRYFISEAVYDRLGKTSPATVDLVVGQGVLGAQVVLAYN